MVRAARILIDHANIGTTPHKDFIDDLALPEGMEPFEVYPTIISKKEKDILIPVAFESELPTRRHSESDPG